MNIKKLYKLLLIGLTVSLNTNTHAMYYPMKAARIVHSLYAMNIRTLYKIGSLFSKKPTTESIPTEKDTHEELSQHHAKTKKHTLNKIKFDRGSSYLFKCVNYYLSKYKQKGFNFCSSNLFLAYTKTEDHVLAFTYTRKREDVDPTILEIIEDYIEFPYVSVIIIDSRIHNFPYGLQKLILGHEVFHCAQFNAEKDVTTTINPDLYPKGPEQEADTQAMLNCGCYKCAKEYAKYLPKKSEDYLTRKEAKEILATMDSHHLCPYHQGRAEGIPHEVLIEEIEKGIRGV
ncbi:TPA: hypothetical protein DIC20_01830 [Candidatus Dependentiae bacterium]|nr:MAG: hypothetical protein US03_C0013G0003 [candidate division TM6 bacterium GW2011_GWF2_36_131]KKQ02546.1 MAG: hypothetical protein US13_C0014G0003 [candidate division TM6 bacterium GW2011_GWE2_36_25]KKQ19301.1 MAG: hypothetical protein US32_C0011G0003 [candidate division TM6 bacterium GW2011_GWA2_36_9]HBR70926.1 hypothetical protein [Candidatus Dependentiae bacterium]HCU00426.1 hypothetical protein [Candidatus Dependentiae bacterium]